MKNFFHNAIPNLFTFANLLSGFLGLCLAVLGSLEAAAYCVLLGIFFDFFDGFFARILKSSSELGKQLDSFADLVTAGLVPAVVMMQIWCRVLGVSFVDTITFKTGYFLPFLPLLIGVASAYRLAKFNLDTRQSTSFIGLPTPANALWIVALPFLLTSENPFSNLLHSPYFLGVLTFLGIFLLNAPIPLFALKFKNFNVKENIVRYLFLLFSIVCFLWLKILAFPLVIFVYVLVSVFNHLFLAKSDVI